MRAETTGNTDTTEMQAAGSEGSRTRSRIKLPGSYAMSSLLIVAAIFAIGALSWVNFYRAAGGTTGLFTQTDFPAVTIASRLLSEGRGAQLYNLDIQLEGQRKLIAEGYLDLAPTDDLKYPYPYTPVIALFMVPFSGLPPTVGMAVWDLLNIAGMAVGLWYLLAGLALARFTRLMLLLGAITSFPFVVNLEQGQSSGVVMLAFGLGIGMLKRGRELPAGVAFGLLVMKIQWLPLLALVLIWKRRWRALGGMVAMAGALGLVTTAVAGTGWVPDYLHLLGRAQQYARELLLDPWYSHSLPGGLTALIGRGTDDVVSFANFVVLLWLVALLLFLWRGRWEPSTTRWDGLVAATLLVAFFTNLQLNTHDLCLLVVPAALGLSYFSEVGSAWRVRAAWLGLAWVIYVASALFLPQVFALPVRISTVVIGAMLGIVAYRLVGTHGTEKASTTRADC